MRKPRIMVRSLAITALLAAALTVPSAASAFETRYGFDDSNPLLIAYHFTHPVGALIDTIVFKPILFVGEHINPPAGQRGGDDVSQGCRDLRPPADCSQRVR